MAFIRKSELTSLENEVRKLGDETVKLTKQKCELDLKLFRTYGRELQEEIADRLKLTATQRSELALIFSIEHARIMGVPEEKIIHNLEEADKFFTGGES